MKKEILSGLFIVTMATATGSGVWAKNNGQGGGMHSSHPQGQMGRDGSREDKYRKESRDKIRKHREEDDAKERREEHEERRHRKEESYREHDSVDNGSPGLNKQRQKKAAQEQKELGRGSEKGQQSREEHSRKWWRFW